LVGCTKGTRASVNRTTKAFITRTSI